MRKQSRKSTNTQITEYSSLWEASTFYSRKHSVSNIYHQKKITQDLLPSLEADIQTDLPIPVIETDLNVMPRDNFCVLDASDENLNYKLINAAVHGLAVLLKNTERYPQSNRLVEILLERDFLYDKAMNRDFIKVSEEDIYIRYIFYIDFISKT